MKILVACEESQAVCKAFRARGHEAYSADIQEPSGGHPEWHILGDVLPLINGDCTFFTMDGGCKDAHGNYRKFQGRKERDPKIRSKTFPGIAEAMADQWGCLHD
jgi:hypothetical protein